MLQLLTLATFALSAFPGGNASLKGNLLAIFPRGCRGFHRLTCLCCFSVRVALLEDGAANGSSVRASPAVNQLDPCRRAPCQRRSASGVRVSARKTPRRVAVVSDAACAYFISIVFCVSSLADTDNHENGGRRWQPLVYTHDGRQYRLLPPLQSKMNFGDRHIVSSYSLDGVNSALLLTLCRQSPDRRRCYSLGLPRPFRCAAWASMSLHACHHHARVTAASTVQPTSKQRNSKP